MKKHSTAFTVEFEIKDEFYYSYKRLVEILADNTLTDEYKEDNYDRFVRAYPFFDTIKLDKYFI